MDLLEIIIITISAVVLLLQFFIIVSLSGIRASIKALTETRSAHVAAPVAAERFDRNNPRRHDRGDRGPRPHHEHHQRPAAAPAPVPVSPVETSLRDINMRLKTAERDQEFARKKLQENLGGDQPRPRDENRGNRDDNRGNRGDRGGRDRGGRDRGGRDRGGRDRNFRRDGAPQNDRYQQQNRNVSPQSPVASQSSETTQPMTQPAASSFEPAPVAAAEARPYIPQSAPVVRQEPAAEAPSDYQTEGEFGHGRKAMVKRRPLREEGAESSVAPEVSPSVEASEPAEEIQFGRRKGA
jgi:hypothetical protein